MEDCLKLAEVSRHHRAIDLFCSKIESCTFCVKPNCPHFSKEKTPIGIRKTNINLNIN